MKDHPGLAQYQRVVDAYDVQQSAIDAYVQAIGKERIQTISNRLELLKNKDPSVKDALEAFDAGVDSAAAAIVMYSSEWD